jgi:hypothetical protein
VVERGVREGLATFMAFDDAVDFLPIELVEHVASGALWQSIPLETDTSVWIPFGVFGIKPLPIKFGEWCGCVELTAHMIDGRDTGLHCRLYHRYNMEKERRVLMLWHEDHGAEGFVVAVDGYKTMREFFRLLKDTWRTESSRGAMN